MYGRIVLHGGTTPLFIVSHPLSSLTGLDGPDDVQGRARPHEEALRLQKIVAHVDRFLITAQIYVFDVAVVRLGCVQQRNINRRRVRDGTHAPDSEAAVDCRGAKVGGQPPNADACVR